MGSVPGEGQKIDWSDPEQVRQYKNERGREWYERNREKARAQKREVARQRREADPEVARERDRVAAARKRERAGVKPREVFRIDAEGRECTKCREYKLWGEYSPAVNAPHGHRSSCRVCIAARNRAHYVADAESRKQMLDRQAAYQKTERGKARARRSHLKSRSGITGEQYDGLLEAQAGVCALHGGPERVTHHANGKLMRLAVDHDHSCDKGHDPKVACVYCVRGLLCYNCNDWVKEIENSPKLLAMVQGSSIVDYLARRPLVLAVSG